MVAEQPTLPRRQFLCNHPSSWSVVHSFCGLQTNEGDSHTSTLTRQKMQAKTCIAEPNAINSFTTCRPLALTLPLLLALASPVLTLPLTSLNSTSHRHHLLWPLLHAASLPPSIHPTLAPCLTDARLRIRSLWFVFMSTNLGLQIVSRSRNPFRYKH